MPFTWVYCFFICLFYHSVTYTGTFWTQYQKVLFDFSDVILLAEYREFVWLLFLLEKRLWPVLLAFLYSLCIWQQSKKRQGSVIMAILGNWGRARERMREQLSAWVTWRPQSIKIGSVKSEDTLNLTTEISFYSANNEWLIPGAPLC